MRILRSIALLAVFAIPAALVSPAAHADTITFGSGFSTVTYSTTNPAGQTGNAVLYTSTNPYGVGSYVVPVAGTSYITWNDSQNESLVPAGVTTYSTTFTTTGSGTGMVSFAADNSVLVYLNGVEIGFSDTFTALTTAGFSFDSGVNTLSFVVTNTEAIPAGSGNPTALDFGGSVDFAPSTVPEPTSIALLGTGLLSVAGLARRKIFRA